MRAAVEQTQPLVIIRLRQRHRAAAVFARPKDLVAEISIFPPHILHLIIAIFSSFFLRQLGSLIFVQSETSH